ncbi:Ig-like domain-containing protein, partial [Vibrio sp. 10N.261.46.C10]|uniref:Ig-like domain-containing protein n=1 Tax=Vibrio sp. 10N.261.46.C10 TaxID=3229660 RepID=UPI00354CD0AD
KGADVTVFIFDVEGNEVTTITVRANDEGYWSANSATELDPGKYTWEVTVTDLAGNTTTSEPQDLTIDIRAQNDDIRLSNDTGRTNDSGSIVKGLDEDGITNNTFPRFSGIAEKGAVVTVVIRDEDGNMLTTMEVNPEDNGSWVADSANGEPMLPDSGLLDGDYTWTVEVTDPAGNHSSSEEFNLSIDTTNVLTAAVQGVAGGQPTFFGETDSMSEVIVTLYNSDGTIFFQDQAIADNDGKWALTVPYRQKLKEGESYQWSITSCDNAGNINRVEKQPLLGEETFEIEEMSSINDSEENSIISRHMFNGSDTYPNSQVLLSLDNATYNTSSDNDGDWSIVVEFDNPGMYNYDLTTKSINGSEINESGIVDIHSIDIVSNDAHEKANDVGEKNIEDNTSKKLIESAPIVDVSDFESSDINYHVI